MHTRELKITSIIVTTIASFMISFMISSINIALPEIAHKFDLNAVVLSWIVLSFLLSTAVFLLPFGKIADIHGRKKIFSLGILIFGISSFLCSISNNVVILIASRIIQGLGSAMIYASNIAILISIFPQNERGAILGINVTSVYIGLSSGPFAGGFLTHYLGWQSLFLVNIPLCAVILIILIWKFKGEWKDRGSKKYDLAGTVFYGLMLTLLMVGYSTLPDIKGLLFIISSFILFVFFIIIEINNDNPIFNINLFYHNKIFKFSNLAALISYSATFGIAFLLSLYLQKVKNFSSEHTGLILLSQPLLQALLSPIAGSLSDRMEPRILSSIGMILTTIGLLILSFLSTNTHSLIIIISLGIIGSGFGFFSSPNSNAIMSSIDRKYYGVGAATLNIMRIIGQIMSMGIATCIFAVFLGNEKISDHNMMQLIKSINVCFIIFALLCFSGIFLSLIRGNIYAFKGKQQ